MVAFKNIAVGAILTASSLAAPSAASGSCLTHDDAQQVATNFGNLLADYNKELANAALTEDYTDYSESVNTLIDSCPQGSAAKPVPLLGPSFTNRTAFEKGQGQQAPINFKQHRLWHNCKDVTVRWSSNNTAPIADPKPVVGIFVLETRPAPAGHKYPYLIHQVFSEFDAGAWLQNLEAAGVCANSSSTK